MVRPGWDITTLADFHTWHVPWMFVRYSIYLQLIKYMKTLKKIFCGFPQCHYIWCRIPTSLTYIFHFNDNVSTMFNQLNSIIFPFLSFWLYHFVCESFFQYFNVDFIVNFDFYCKFYSLNFRSICWGFIVNIFLVVFSNSYKMHSQCSYHSITYCIDTMWCSRQCISINTFKISS